MNWTDLYRMSSSRPEAAHALMEHAMAAVFASTNASLQFSVAGAPASPFAVCLALDAYGVPVPVHSNLPLKPAA